jgi:glycosyltransferase involved in cell wall biosynthesis
VLGPSPVLSQQREAAAIPGLILHQTGLDLDWTAPDPATLQGIAADLAELAACLGVDSVHLHAPALVGDDADWPVPVVAVLHSCLLTWWQAMRQGVPPPDFAWRIAATAAGLRRAGQLVVPSRAFGDAVQAAYGLARPVVPIRNGRHPLPVPVQAAVRRPRAALAAGRFWDEGKDVVTLDAASALLDATLSVAGSFIGPNGERASAPALDQLGSLDETGLAAAFAGARVFVSTARYEPFGLAVLEAAQAGLALVLSDIPTFRELWDGAACFVAPGHAAGFAAALSQALDDPTSLADAARTRARLYSAAAMADATLALHRPASVSQRIA